MKKLLLVLGILSLGAVGFADTKSDYENVGKLVKEGKVQEALKLLHNVANSKDKNYVGKANYQLGFYYGQANDVANAKKYLTLAWNDSAISKDEKMVVSELLYTIALSEKDTASQEKYIKYLMEESKGQNSDYMSSYILMYISTNREAEGLKLYDSVMKGNQNNQFKSIVNYNLGRFYLQVNNIQEAKKYLINSYNLSNELVVPAGSLLSQIFIQEKDYSQAEAILIDMNNKTGGKSIQVLEALGSYYYYISNDYDKSILNYEKVLKLDPNNIDSRVMLLAIFETKKDDGNINKNYNELKNLIKENLNQGLGNAYALMGNVELSEKYLKKSIKEDKNDDSKLQLAQLYALTGQKDKAITVLKEAGNIKGVKELLEEVEKMK